MPPRLPIRAPVARNGGDDKPAEKKIAVNVSYKRSAQIGTTAAFKTLQQYLEWPERIEYLAKLGLLDSMEEDPAQLVNVCPDTSCGHQLSRLFEARTLVF